MISQGQCNGLSRSVQQPIRSPSSSLMVVKLVLKRKMPPPLQSVPIEPHTCSSASMADTAERDSSSQRASWVTPATLKAHAKRQRLLWSRGAARASEVTTSDDGDAGRSGDDLPG